MNKKRHQILQDHKKVGKKLLPPFNYMLNTGFTDLSWVDIILPEVIWISLLNDLYGYAEGAHLVAEIAKNCATIIKEPNRNWCFSVSSFLAIQEVEKAAIYDALGGVQGDSGMIGAALKVLHDTYPKSPFSFFTDRANSIETPEDGRKRLKNVICSLYDKTTVEAIFTQANVVYSAFVAGHLTVRKGLALADFPEIEHYPHTEKSKMVAASIRSTVPVFFGMQGEAHFKRWWPTYFWNRGMEIEPCEFK